MSPIALLALFSPAHAGTSEIIAAVEAKYGTVDAIAADFTQTTKSQMFGEQVSKGDMTVARPSKMRWNFTEGQGQQFVTDGRTMWIYNAAQKQVLKYDDVSQANTGANSLLQSLDRISEMFDIEVLEDSPESKRLTLKPKKADGQLKRIELGLTGELVVQDVLVVDAFDTQTALAFTNVNLAPKLEAGLFAFTPPPGSKVIEN